MREIRLAGILIIVQLLSSCVNTKCITNSTYKNQDWVSFDVTTCWYQEGRKKDEIYSAHVIIHRTNDSTDSMAIFTAESLTLLTAERIITINTDYEFIAIYPDSVFWYDEGVAAVLQTSLDYFPMYYPKNNNYRVVIDEKPIEQRIEEGDTIMIFGATKLVKQCYVDGYCELKKVPVQYTYSTKRNFYIAATEEINKSKNKFIVSEITNLSYDNKNSLIADAFNISKPRYKQFDHIPVSEYYPQHVVYTENTTMTDTILDWPIINLLTGDTSSLRQMHGLTLLHFFSFDIDNDWYTTDQQTVTQYVDNVIWLMPLSNNTYKLKFLSNTERLGNNIYYTKGFTKYLSSEYDAYLISPEYSTISCFNRQEISFKEWIEKCRKDGKFRKKQSFFLKFK